jgi:hypothetical protein
MGKKPIEVLKSSGERVRFSTEKLRKSLRASGANDDTVQKIIDVVRDELYHGISTQEIYERAFAQLKKEKSLFASKYKLKKAIYELGPTGFPFERFVAAILKYSGYHTRVGVVLPGKCVSHEVDVVADKKSEHIIVECKFHSDQGRKCDVKVPLYIHSRYQDILQLYGKTKTERKPTGGWVVTNTRFTRDARAYGRCCGLNLLSWDEPAGDALKDRIDRLGLYPITVSTLLSNREKQFLLSRDVVLCRELLGDHFYLDQLEISANRQRRILKEIELLCTINNHFK